MTIVYRFTDLIDKPFSLLLMNTVCFENFLPHAFYGKYKGYFYVNSKKKVNTTMMILRHDLNFKYYYDRVLKFSALQIDNEVNIN